jgi:hypothetical protein
MPKKIAPKKRVSEPLRSGFSFLDDNTLRGSFNSATCVTSGVDVLSLIRHSTSETEVIRVLASYTSILSSSVFHLTTLANTKMRFKVSSRTSGKFDLAGTRLVTSVVSSLDDIESDGKGFNTKKGIQTLNGTLLQEVLLSGGVMVELVLEGMLRTPKYLVPLALDRIFFRERKGTKLLIPFQDGVELDYPNIFFASLHQHANTIKPKSMLSPAVGSVLSFSEFMESMEQAIEISGHNRLVVTLNKDMLLAHQPDECINDPSKRDIWLGQQRDAVQTALTELQPQDALVLWEGSQDAQVLESSSTQKDYSELLGTLLGILALSLKSNSALLGLRVTGAGQNTSSTESLLAMKTAASIQTPVAEVWTRACNLILRLVGLTDLVCTAEFTEISLRPELELASFRLITQKSTLEKLSLGMITDDEAAWELGILGLPEGYKNLSGTGFATSNGDTNIAQAVSNSQDPMGRASAPKDSNASE